MTAQSTTGVSVEELSDLVEFDVPFETAGDATVICEIPGVQAPDYVHDDISPDGWQLQSGWSGQQSAAGRYRGPTMHPSETLSSAMAAHVLTGPGRWVVTAAYSTSPDGPDDEPCGWYLLKAEDRT